MSENTENKQIPESELTEVSGGKIDPVGETRTRVAFVVYGRRAYRKDRRAFRTRMIPIGYLNRTEYLKEE